MRRFPLVFVIAVTTGPLIAQELVRPKMTPKRTDVRPFEYVEANIPFYPPSGERTGAKPKMQKPLSPEESMKHFITPEGFEVRLFAAEPRIRRPICMNWDERGRLWIAESVDYPNERRAAGEGRDRLVICEDTDGDGQADKFTVFADKLSVPTGFTFYKGGVIVVQAPETLYLKDTTGDDVADERRVLFTGWGTRDTHAGPSNLHWGFDNWIYGVVGYSGFEGIVGGERHKFNQGFWRCKPDGSKLEFLRSTNNNTWGLGFSEDGQLFGSTANGNPSMHMPMANRYFERVRGWSAPVLSGIAGNPDMELITDKVRQVDQHGRFTAACGHALYTARHYPKEYWNRTAFVCEPTGHLVATFVLEPRGATFKARMAWNLLVSDDEWSAPIMAEVGPDGSVWVIDWYNFIVQHNPTPAGFKTGPGNAYETELRDKTHGRIYRIVPTGAAKAERVTLQNATSEKLVATLKHDNLFWREHAQRLLVERGNRDILPALLELMQDKSMDDLGLNPGAVHALWTLEGLGAFPKASFEQANRVRATLKHPSAGVRQAALASLPDDVVGNALLVNVNMNDVLRGAEPGVRLAALLAIASGVNSGGPAVGDALRKQPALAADPILADALVAAAAADPEQFFSFVLQTTHGPMDSALAPIVERVAEHYGRGGKKGSEKMHKFFAGITSGDRTAADAIIAGLARSWPAGETPNYKPLVEQTFPILYQKLSPAGRGRLAQLALRMGSNVLDKQLAEIANGLLATASNPRSTDELRATAASQFIDLRKTDPKAPRALLELIQPQSSSDMARHLLEAIARSETPTTGADVVRVLPTLTPSVRPAAVRLLLSRSEWTAALLDAFDKGQLTLAELSLDQKLALAHHPDRALAERARPLLAKGGGLPSADRQKVIDELEPLLKETGDAGKGKAVFKAQCAKCHMHTGEGANIGPDLTGMAVHSKHHLLVEILDPSRSVEGNFRQYVVTLKSGKILNGLLASESKTALDILDSEAKKHSVQRDEIDELQATNKSLMPEGFEKQIKKEELVDLLAFLTARGQYTPLPLTKVATAISTLGMFHAKDSNVERLVFADWGPKKFKDVPFVLVDPQSDRVPNVILMHGPQGAIPPTMPKSVRLAWGAPAKSIHLLGGVSGWGYPGGTKGSVSLIVRLHYAHGKTEDHPLRNGEHFADYIRRIDVPSSEFAFALRGQQIRYLAVHPKETGEIREIEFVKGNDATAPIIMAVTVEKR